jgi:hypothetical protein
MHCSAVSSKVNEEIMDGLITSRFSAKIVQATMVEITLTQLEEIIALIVANQDFKLKKKESRYVHNQAGNNNNGNYDRENYDSQDVVFVATSKNESFMEDI